MHLACHTVILKDYSELTLMALRSLVSKVILNGYSLSVEWAGKNIETKTVDIYLEVTTSNVSTNSTANMENWVTLSILLST